MRSNKIYPLKKIVNITEGYTVGIGAIANCELECGHSAQIRVNRNTNIIIGQSRARCKFCTPKLTTTK